MRILLTANASYSPPRGGATRSNLVWLDHMARAGHECRIVCGPPDEGAAYAPHPSLAIFPVADPAARVERLRREILDWRPDWVLVSSEDLSHTLLREAHHSAPGRIVYLAHTPQFFPFGPESWNSDPAATALVAQSAGIVAIGQHMAAYIEHAIHRRPAAIHPPIYGAGPWPDYANFESGSIVMINPCAVKGIGIFLAAAARMPRSQFAAVPGWGTTAEDRAALARLPNVRILPNAIRIDDILAQTRILMMPSLWYEGFGLIVMEAMLRGIPVVASDSGGLKEAKQGTGYVLPARTIERYEAAFDEHAMPKPVLPVNDEEPWVAALEELLTDREAYNRESTISRQAAQNFVQSLDPAAFEHYLANLRPRLKILLAQNAVYHPALGGGEKSNRLLMEALAARGHQCRVVARGAADLDLQGVHIRAAADTQLRATFLAEAISFRPDVILCSTDDPAQLLLEPALAFGARVVYLVRATLPLPFGSDCAFPNESQSARIRQADAVVGVSQYAADYVRRHAGIDAVHVPISLMPREPWPDLGRFDNEFVTMVNPCAVKGIAIFLALADAFPEVRFAAVPTWGADAADRAALAARPNVTVLDPVEHIDTLLTRTRVLLVPSLWAEARSRIVVEAMLRAVPVIAANTGGLPEAKMGVPYLLPVSPIARYQPRLNESMVPIAEIPPQDVAPWIEALRRLISDRAHYDEISRQSRDAARHYAANLSVEPFEALLSRTRRVSLDQPQEAPPVAPPESLSPEKLALLAVRLRKRAPASAWFPTAAAAQPPRLFYFPYAGEIVVAQVTLADPSRTSRPAPAGGACPAVLPGRGPRIAEAPFQRMAPLIQSLTGAIQPYLAQPFAFLGHSLGAIVAFELARELRRRNLPLPRLLIASAARAPQFRRNHVPPPEPPDEDLLREANLPDDAAIRHAVLPALRADTHLYRHYVYTEDPPLPVPIRAYGGLDDPHISRTHLEAWCEQTTESFALRQFSGGHFYLKEHRAEFDTALHEDL
jgi:surfactin synthase thioesterase subunit/glycosyltransferase involved in cell wall biosynthesis